MPSPIPAKSEASKTTNDDDDTAYFDDVPSTREVPQSGNRGTFKSITASNKQVDSSLLDPDAFARGSFSTVSGLSDNGRGRSTSHISNSRFVSRSPTPAITWRASFGQFWGRNRGLALVTLSQFFGSVMNVATRVLELEGEGMHPFQLLFVRFIVTAILAVAYMWYTRVPDFPLGKRELRVLLCYRGIFGFFGVCGLYYSLLYLPLADATVIGFLAPPIAGYGCYVFFNERFTRMEQIASFVSLCGVFLIARPTSIFGVSSPTSASSPPSNSTSISTGYEFLVPTPAERLSSVGAAIIGVLGTAGALTCMRWIGKSAHPLISVNYFSVTCTVISAIALSTASRLPEPFTTQDLYFKLPVNLRQWCLLAMLGTCGFVFQFLLTAGMAHEKSNRATNMIYTSMLFALLFDRLVFGTVPSLWSLLGSGLILGSAVYVVVQKGIADVTNVRPRASFVPDEEIGMLQDLEHEEEDVESLPLTDMFHHHAEISGTDREAHDETYGLRGDSII